MAEPTHPAINFDPIFQKSEVTIVPPEHPDDRAARLAISRRSKSIDDCKGIALFVVVLIGVFSVGAICMYLIVFDGSASDETRRWAQTMLAAILTGSVSYLLGRASPRSGE